MAGAHCGIFIHERAQWYKCTTRLHDRMINATNAMEQESQKSRDDNKTQLPITTSTSTVSSPYHVYGTMWQRMKSWLGRNDDNNNKRKEAANPEAKLSHTSLLVITKEDSKAQRQEKLMQSFVRNMVIMTVREQDLLPASIDDHPNEEMYRGQLILPRCPEVYGSAIVPNCCVICLDSYHPGDSVVWSFHSACQHAFHEECVLKYLVRIQTKIFKSPCCVCRCDFTDLEVEPRERHIRRRGRGGRRTVRTRHNFDALELPAWWTTSSSR